MDRWRLLLVDDHALFREGLAGLFAYQDDSCWLAKRVMRRPRSPKPPRCGLTSY